MSEHNAHLPLDHDARLKVVVAEDNALARFGIRRALEDDGFAVCAELDDAGGAIEAVRRERPDVCLLDLHLADGALEAVEAIASGVPETAVVVLTVSRNDPKLFDALCAGASGYVPQDIDPERIPAALRNALSGEIALPRSVVKKLVDEFGQRTDRRRLALFAAGGPKLSDREWEVLELLREGLATAEIARRLFISQVTVRSHVRSIVRKLSVADRNAAIRLFDQALGRDAR